MLTQTRLFRPLGLTSDDIRWRTPAGNFTDPVYGIPATEFNGGMSANVNAMARLGYLFLNGGNWNGRQIVSSSFVATSTKPYYPRIPISIAEAVRPPVVEQWQRLAGRGPARRLLVHGQEQQPHAGRPQPRSRRGPRRHRRLEQSRWQPRPVLQADLRRRRGLRLAPTAVAPATMDGVAWMALRPTGRMMRPLCPRPR